MIMGYLTALFGQNGCSCVFKVLVYSPGSPGGDALQGSIWPEGVTS